MFSTFGHAEVYSYDAIGRLVSVTYDDGSRISYTYAQNGNRLNMVVTGVDSDHDGMPNWWEELHNLSPVSSSNLDGPDGDRDSDGVRNLDEWLADTDPNDSSSFLKINLVQLDPSGAAITVDSSQIRIYTLEFSPDLKTPFVPIETKQGTDAELTLYARSPPDGSGFYRISVEIFGP